MHLGSYQKRTVSQERKKKIISLYQITIRKEVGEETFIFKTIAETVKVTKRKPT